jgi:hypothetical protein
MKEWSQYNRLMQLWFGSEEENIVKNYIGESDLEGHFE